MFSPEGGFPADLPKKKAQRREKIRNGVTERFRSTVLIRNQTHIQYKRNQQADSRFYITDIKPVLGNSLAQGRAYPFRELLAAMLLASSNECALALAEHLDGSEALFVEHMNLKARELGMESAHFYNPHGLPGYLPGAITNKSQNVMSARDLFLLCQILLRDYPEITGITRQQFGSMPSLKYITANSNALVFNLEGCSGLKTGSTNKAGSCLVATLPVTVGGETHTAVAIVLGSEGPDNRNQAAEILLRYARDTWEEQGFLWQEDFEELELPTPGISLPWHKGD